MSLVELIDADAASPEARPMLESGRAQYGAVLATWRALLHRPPIFTTYLPYLRAVAGPGVVDPRVKALAALRVAILNHCRYTAAHRAHAASAAGMTDEDLAALLANRLDHFDEPARVAIEFASQLTLRPPVVRYPSAPQAVDPGLLRRLRATFADPQIVELTASISLWNALARFHRVMDFDLDMPSPPAVLDEVL